MGFANVHRKQFYLVRNRRNTIFIVPMFEVIHKRQFPRWSGLIFLVNEFVCQIFSRQRLKPYK